MTDQPKQWVQNPKWLRTESGTWINRDSIQSVYTLCMRHDDMWSIQIVTLNDRHELIGDFKSEEAAQSHLDKLQIFYDLKPAETPHE